jgi:hypothetical protein
LALRQLLLLDQSLMEQVQPILQVPLILMQRVLQIEKQRVLQHHLIYLQS